MSQDFAVLVLSCDKYSDLWAPFFKCFWKFFPAYDCTVYLGSNTVPFDDPKVKTLFSGEDVDWSSSYRKILQQIPEKKIFVILEDLFVASPINEDIFLKVIAFVRDRDANHLRYLTHIKPSAPLENPLFGVYDKKMPYRATVCGFWDREYLLDLLLDGESPWNFEIMGSYRTSYSDGFYAMVEPLFELKNMVEKGCWIPASAAWAQQEGIQINLEARSMLSGFNQFKSVIQMRIFDAIVKTPWKLRLALMNQLRKLFISY